VIQSNSAISSRLFAVESLLLWAKLLYYLKGFESTGSLVRMVIMTSKEVRT
jgi:hypothetical protein